MCQARSASTVGVLTMRVACFRCSLLPSPACDLGHPGRAKGLGTPAHVSPDLEGKYAANTNNHMPEVHSMAFKVTHLRPQSSLLCKHTHTRSCLLVHQIRLW